MTETEYIEAEEDMAGFCIKCKKIVNHGSVEPDARQYTCELCENPTVYGVPEALIEGLIEIE